MRFAYWAAGQARYAYVPVLTRFPYRESVYESAKARAKKWEKPHDLLIQQGKNPKLLNELDTHNLEVLRENEQLAEFGVDISQLPPRYKLRTEDFEPLSQFLSLNHCMVAGLLADVHHLLQHDTAPVLPQWLQTFLAQGVSAELLQPVIDAFRQVLQGLAIERVAWAADLSVEFATSLASLPDKTWAQAALVDSLQYWLHSRGETVISDGWEARISAVRAVLTVVDAVYVQKLQACLNLLDGQTHALALQKSLEKQQHLETEIERRLQLVLQQRAEAEAERKAAEEAARAEAERKAAEEEAQKWVDGRYRINGDGTVTDTSTKLMWKQAPEAGKYHWDEAMATFGKNVSFAGYNDWRMPTIDELKSLIDDSYHPTIRPVAFPNTPATVFWSASPDVDGGYSAWYVNFYYGYDGWYNKDNAFQVRLVRSGQ